jgi:eukaryotic-like serine/threonine-protein kinase
MTNELSSSTSAHTRVGEIISGRYVIHALLGEGGMGAVYLAEHAMMRKRFALKLLHPEIAENEEVIARFRREAEAAAQLEHPNIVAATDFGRTEDGAFFLVLEYIDGKSLRDRLAAGALEAARAIRIARQIAFALGRAHDAGIVHRDVKPENVMLVRKGEDPEFVKVLDFGIARFNPQEGRDQGQPLTRLGTVMGTPEYMAPEQALGEPVTARSDLYSLGVLLYEMLTGVRPFDGDTMAMLSMHIVAPVPTMAERAPGVAVPPAVEAVVRRLLEKDAAVRYESARAVVDAMDEAAAASGLHIPALESERLLSRPSIVDRPSAVVVPAAGASSPSTQREVFAKTALGAPAVERPAAPTPSLEAKMAPLVAQAKTLLASIEQTTGVPRRIAVAVAAAIPLVVLVLVVSVVIIRRSGASTGGGAIGLSLGSEQASAEAIRAAAAKGPVALEELAAKRPGDVAVLRELAFAYDAAGRPSDALAAVQRAVTAAPGAVPIDLVRIVARAASKFETADAAFALLEDSLGEPGVDALIELSESTSAPPATRARAQKSLTRGSVRQKASPAAAILLDLRAATTCEERRNVVGRAVEHADARAVPELMALAKKGGCGRRRRHDCHPCLRKDDTLSRALAAAEARASN